MSSPPDAQIPFSAECEKRLKILETHRAVYTEVEYKEERRKILALLTSPPQTTVSNDVTLSKTVASHWAEEAQKALYPWWSHKKKAENRQAVIETQFTKGEHWEKLKESFLTNARNKELPAINVLIGHYLMYAENLEASRYILMYMLTNYTSQECVETHNWYIAKLWDEGTMISRGEQIAELAYPLFPASMNELNSKLIRAQQKTGTTMAGGGEDPVKDFYKKHEEDVLHGGGYIPVYDAQGTQVGVGDLAELEKQLNAFTEQMHCNLQRMNKQIEDVRKQPTTQSTYARSYTTRGGMRAYSGRGRGYGRGGYRGGFRGGNMDECMEGEDEPKTVAKN